MIPSKHARTAANACYGETCQRYQTTISFWMNAAQGKTLQAIFEKPTRADVRWSKVEGLVRGLGGEVSEGRGSRVRFRLGERVATFHGPHPSRVTGKATLEDVRHFFENAGIKP
jgi:hypothetical protein